MEAFPLQWPVGWKRTANPQPSRFGSHGNKPTIANARDFLIQELGRMGAHNIVISTNLELRIDGLPYSNQKIPVDKGGAVYFISNKMQMVIACDTFNNIACNIYGIAKSIKAMRGIDRWGCSQILQRAFTGFKALPEQGSASSWWKTLQCEPTSSPDQVKAQYRSLVKQHHPDTGGNKDIFIQIQQAYDEYKKVMGDQS